MTVDQLERAVLGRIVRWIADVTDRPEAEIGPHCTLFELGVDSLDLVRIGRRMSRETSVTLSIAEMMDADRSVAELSRVVAGRMPDTSSAVEPTP
ncbi:MAG: acyl carrier protein [Pseudonocardia sp.]